MKKIKIIFFALAFMATGLTLSSCGNSADKSAKTDK